MSLQNITFYPSKKATLRNTLLEPLALFANGHPVKVISDKLGKADPTINNQLVSARHYYHATNTTQAVAIAIAMGDIRFKFLTTHSTTLRISVVAFALLAGVVSIQSTPFAGPADTDISRYTRIARSHRTSKNPRHDTLIDLLNA